MYYVSFVLSQDAAKQFNQNDDDTSCVTVVTGTTGTTFYTQLKIFNLPEEFGNVVDKAQSESKTKRTGAASGHLQDFMDEISHQLGKWEDLEYCHTTHDFKGNLELTWVSMLRIKRQ